MSDGQRYRLEVLNSHHPIRNFTCENDDIDEYIQEYALTDMARNVARTFVHIDTSKPATNNVAGFFTFRAHALRIEETYFDDWEPDEEGAGYKAELIEVPIIELMWLARDAQWIGQGVGDTLMIDALKMVATTADCVGIIGVHLRSTPRGVGLYKEFGFQPFIEHPYYDSFRYTLSISALQTILQKVQ